MTTAAELAERYGRTPQRRRRAWLIGIAVVAAVLVAALAWSVVNNSMNSVRADDLSMSVVDERTVEVQFQVSGPVDRDMACALEALDEQFGIVGWKVVEIPASANHTQAFTERIPTVSEATTGLVNSCWVT